MSELVELLGSLNETYVQIILLASGLNKDPNVRIGGVRPPPNYQCFVNSFEINKVKKLTSYVPLFYSITLRSFCWPDVSIKILLYGWVELDHHLIIIVSSNHMKSTK
jgi:hypothetical protein